MASEDRILSTARYQAGDGDAVQAFPLGGRCFHALIASDVPRALTSDELPPACSLFTVDIPAGRKVYVGRREQVAGLTGDAARAKMFPLVGGTQRTYTLDDEHQPVAVFLADAGEPLDLALLEAAFLGGGAA